MARQSIAARLVAATLIVGLQLLVSPAVAGTPSASLSGEILSAETKAAVPGAVVKVLDPNSGEIVSSMPTDANGHFRIAGLAPATYHVGVETEQGLYAADAPVALSPGEDRSLQIAVKTFEASGQTAKADSAWDNPLAATGIVIGIAFGVGILIEGLTDDRDRPVVSPSTPGI